MRTLLIYGALKRRRSETVPGTLTFDIVDMSTLGRQYTEVCESVLPNVPKIYCLVSKLARAFKMIQVILLYACFCSVNERSNVKKLFLFRKTSWLERTTCTGILCSDGHITGSSLGI